MVRSIHRLLLGVFRRLPARGQVAVVHAVAPSHSVGAAAVVRDEAGAMLLVRQSYRSGWGLPGGLLVRGEHPVDAVVREVREEVGLVIEVTSEPAVVVDPPTRRVDVVFAARPRSSAAAPARPVSVEIAEVGWFLPGSLPVLQPEAAGAIAALARWEQAAQAAGQAGVDGHP